MSKYIAKNLRLKKDVVDRIQKIADAENRSFNNMVEVILTEESKKRMWAQFDSDIKQLQKEQLFICKCCIYFKDSFCRLHKESKDEKNSCSQIIIGG